jgi:DNA-binding NarL/FixJ family response regulator
MTKEDLSYIADALLALCQRDRSAPFYSETGFATKLRLAEKRENALFHLLERREDGGLLAQECREVLDAANLTKRQRMILDLRLEGRTFDEIGQRYGVTRQGVQRVFVQGLKKIARSLYVYQFAGLSEVYQSEVRRGLIPRPFGTMKR